MVNLLKFIQKFRFGHGIDSNGTIFQQLTTREKFFVANKFSLRENPDFQIYTEFLNAQVAQTDYNIDMRLLNNDLRKDDQNLHLPNIMEVRASKFLNHSRERYRRLFPEAKISDEKFKFPTISQLKGFMEASQGRCAWSGIQGIWKMQSCKNTMFLLSFDHKVPVSRRGSWNVDNLQIVLRMYNSVKGNESEMEFQRWLFHY
ncbi:hypothetical protein [Parasitella parasitica]|uniref:HNH nuclease domain-containing protein n=1 Tax=Parasitella parasitica TaxID=35722 RepID=A0A0B7N7C2_9FUNG|nr:hypothetical protein [Parasitella parasitica]